MSKLLKTTLALSSIILFGAGCARQNWQTQKGNLDGQTPTGSAVSAPNAAVPEAVIEYSNGLFNPSTLRVLPGTRVTFVNKGTKEVWPASGMHPTHLICPGFDALKGLKKGETYSHVFDKPSKCPFHNHVAPGEKGTIEVKAE